MQAELHDGFKAVVRRLRRGRLNGEDSELFEGDIWTGRRALDLGLIDGIGDLRSVMRERFGDKVKLHVVGEHQNWLRRRFSFADPGRWASEALAAAEERALWSRYGL